MKKLFVILLLSSLIGLLSCGPTREEMEAKERENHTNTEPCPHKFERGDVVEVKPDHQKAVIIGFEPDYCPSVVYWIRRGDGVQEKIQQELIYGLAKDEER